MAGPDAPDAPDPTAPATDSGPPEVDDERGERLAAWLEGLGLADHLGDAGLPSFARDRAGRARWSDPATGAPLSEAQLAELDDLLHHEGSEPRHAVPVPLVQVARLARQRARLLEGDWFDYAGVAAVRGTSVDAARFVVHKHAEQHRLLVLVADERTVVPAFQLSADGEPRPDLAPVLEPLLAAGMDPWRAWAWLTQPAALLGGLVPEQETTDPEAVPMVLHAAVRLAERISARS